MREAPVPGALVTGSLVLGTLVLGAVTGTAAVLVHTGWAWLVLGVLAAAATLRWLPPNGPRIGFAVGWCIAVARGTLARPEGDYLVSADAQGWTLRGASLAVLVAALATVRVRPARGDDPGVRGTPT